MCGRNIHISIVYDLVCQLFQYPNFVLSKFSTREIRFKLFKEIVWKVRHFFLLLPGKAFLEGLPNLTFSQIWILWTFHFFCSKFLYAEYHPMLVMCVKHRLWSIFWKILMLFRILKHLDLLSISNFISWKFTFLKTFSEKLWSWAFFTSKIFSLYALIERIVLEMIFSISNPLLSDKVWKTHIFQIPDKQS